MNAAVFAAVFCAMFAAHHIGDHTSQTDADANRKANPGRHGWAAMARHLATYHAGMVLALWALLLIDVPLTTTGVLAGVGFSVVTHGFIDRRWPVRWLLHRTGSAAFADRQTPICGMYLADQSLHVGCLFVAALLVVMCG